MATGALGIRKCTTTNAEADTVHQENWTRNWVAFWFIGMINNFFYCIVLDAADHIAEEFHLKSFVALISWANIFCGLFFKILNAFVFTRTSYNKRFLLTAVQAFLGLLIVSLAKYFGSSDGFRFFVALMGITFIGNASAYGESVCLGYLERFPSKMVGAWSSGTGMSGVLSAVLYLLFTRAMGISNTAAFFCCSPLILLYSFMYFKVIVAPVKVSNRDLASNFQEAAKNELGSSAENRGTGVSGGPNGRELATEQNLQGDDAENGVSTKERLIQDEAEEHSRAIEHRVFGSNWLLGHWHSITPLEGEDQDDEKKMSIWAKFSEWKQNSFPRIKKIHHTVLWNNLNLMTVYIAEYAAQFMAPFSFPCVAQKHSQKFLLANGYVLTQFAYQVGVLCSRSSLSCMRIRRVWILSVIQTVNAIGWFIQAKTLFISSSYDGEDAAYAGSDAESTEEWCVVILLVWMFGVGLLGGAAYVNVFYNILETDVLSHLDDDEESEGEEETTRRHESANLRDAASTDAVVGYSSTAAGETTTTVVAAQCDTPEAKAKQVADRARKDREMAVNIGAIYAVIGITCGSVVDVIISNTLLNTTCQ